jgi:hypothetical protein
MAQDERRKKAEEVLAAVWWDTIVELGEVVNNSEDTNHRIRAAEVLLNYCSTMNTGLGPAFLPDEPIIEDEDEDE